MYIISFMFAIYITPPSNDCRPTEYKAKVSITRLMKNITKIGTKLKPTLKNQINIPADPKNNNITPIKKFLAKNIRDPNK